MKAIVLTRANRDAIIDTDCGITIKELDLMIEEYDTVVIENCLIFVPNYADSEHSPSWATFAREGFELYFKPVDMEKMKTEFVEITPKEHK